MPFLIAYQDGGIRHRPFSLILWARAPLHNLSCCSGSQNNHHQNHHNLHPSPQEKSVCNPTEKKIRSEN